MEASAKTLIVDGDGVAINFTAGYAAYLKAELGLSPLGDEPTQFNYTDMYPMLEKPWSHIPAFTNSDFFEQTPFYPEAISALQAIHQQGTRILMVTSCGDAEHVKKARLACINRHVGNAIDDVIFLPLGGGKREILSTLPKSTFVDDQLSMCIDGALAGHQSFLFDRRYNRNVTLEDLHPHGIHRALSWHCLPHIGHDNAPRTPSERMAMQLAIELHQVELTPAQRDGVIRHALSERFTDLHPKQVDSVLNYIARPYSNAFERAPEISQLAAEQAGRTVFSTPAVDVDLTQIAKLSRGRR